jgi:hypothetical protein
MNPDDNTRDHTEELLRSTLQAKAVQVSTDLAIEDIRRSASTVRRGGRRRVVLLAAAAAVVLAVGLPTALLLSPAHDGGPAPAPSPPPTTSASTSPSPSPTASPAGVLGRLPRSAAPGITYLDGRTVHLASGGTATLPGDDRVAAFAAYHGGWLVADDDTATVRWYDNGGTLGFQGKGLGLFAVSADGTRLAYPLKGEIHIGITSGMGEGEDTVAVSDPGDVWPIGFLSDGALVYNDAGRVKTNEPIGVSIPSSMARARAVSVDDVVAGEDKSGRGQAFSVRSGTTLWSDSDWTVWAFSADGRYAAATNSPTGGDVSTVAILDAHNGSVIAQQPLIENQILMDEAPAFDTDDSLLFVGIGHDNDDDAILRLTGEGVLSRATTPVAGEPGSTNFVLSASR